MSLWKICHSSSRSYKLEGVLSVGHAYVFTASLSRVCTRVIHVLHPSYRNYRWDTALLLAGSRKATLTHFSGRFLVLATTVKSAGQSTSLLYSLYFSPDLSRTLKSVKCHQNGKCFRNTLSRFSFFLPILRALILTEGSLANFNGG